MKDCIGKTIKDIEEVNLKTTIIHFTDGTSIMFKAVGGGTYSIDQLFTRMFSDKPTKGNK